MGPGEARKGDSLRSALAARGILLTPEQAAHLVPELLRLIDQGLLVPAAHAVAESEPRCERGPKPR